MVYFESINTFNYVLYINFTRLTSFLNINALFLLYNVVQIFSVQCKQFCSRGCLSNGLVDYPARLGTEVISIQGLGSEVISMQCVF